MNVNFFKILTIQNMYVGKLLLIALIILQCDCNYNEFHLDLMHSIVISFPVLMDRELQILPMEFAIQICYLKRILICLGF